jgi:hypothetical protein
VALIRRKPLFRAMMRTTMTIMAIIMMATKIIMIMMIKSERD